MNRLQLTNNTHFVEFENNLRGMKQAVEFRKAHKEFKGRHITPVLQLMPKHVKTGEIYKIERWL